jgi:hypothetical protein
MLVDDIYIVTMVRATWFERGGRPTSFNPTKTSRVKRLSILFQLEYWKVGQYNHDLNHRLFRI